MESESESEWSLSQEVEGGGGFGVGVGAETDRAHIGMEEEACSTQKGREHIPDRSMAWTVRRRDYPTRFFLFVPYPGDSPCPCLGQNTSPMHTRSLKVLLPTLCINVFLDDFVFLPDTNPHGEDKQSFRENPDRNMKETSTILIFYYHRQNKRMKTGQRRMKKPRGFLQHLSHNFKEALAHLWSL